MSKEELREYLDRVERLEIKLLDEDKETLQWLIFGYNQCAKLLQETEQKIDKANKILSKSCFEYDNCPDSVINEIIELKKILGDKE